MNTMLGRICAIFGPMFSGKTTRLIELAQDALNRGETVLLVKPWLDTRYNPKLLCAHSGRQFPAISVTNAADILPLLEAGISFIGIDEAQFFDEKIIEVCQKAKALGIQVFVSGLDFDFRGQPFGSMPHLIALADDVIRLMAWCDICGQPAEFSQRLVNHEASTSNEPIVLIGGKETYEARCKLHFIPPGKENEMERKQTVARVT